MNAAAFKQNTEFKLKNCKKIFVKAGNSSTTKHRKKQALNMNAMLIMKYSSTIMLGKRKLYECYTRFFILRS